VSEADPFIYDAFISYRHVQPDRSFAARLHRALETFKPPRGLVAGQAKASIARVFRDEEEIAAEPHLPDAIRNALRQSRFLIVVCSPNAPQSEWIRKEIEFFVSLGRRDRIITALIAGEPAQSFPQPLYELRKTAHATDEVVEPRAADFRAETWWEGRRKFRIELLRVVATVIGCRFDDLRQRHLERQRRQLLGVVAVLTTAFLVLIGLASFAVLQRNDAVAQRAEAETQREAAVAQRREADRQKGEAERQRAEAERQRTEAEREKAEAERQRTEADRQKAEALRHAAEAERQRTEAERERAEAERQRAEADRQKAEAVRHAAEAERQRMEAEQRRRETEVARGDAEQQRQEAVRQKLTAEQERDRAVIAGSAALATTVRARLRQGEGEAAQSLAAEAAAPFVADRNLSMPSNTRMALWETRLSRRTLAGRNGQGAYEHIVFHPSGDRLFAVTHAGPKGGSTLWRFDAPALDLARTYRQGEERISATAISSEGSILAVGFTRGRIDIVDTATFQRLRSIQVGGGSINLMDFDPRSRRIVVMSSNGELNLVDAQSGTLERLGAVDVRNTISSPGFDFSRSGRFVSLAMPGWQQSVVLIDLQTKRQISTIGPVKSIDDVAFAKLSDDIAITGNGHAIVWDTAANRYSPVENPIGGRPFASDIAYSDDGTVLAILEGTEPHGIVVVDARTLKAVRSLEGGGLPLDTPKLKPAMSMTTKQLLIGHRGGRASLVGLGGEGGHRDLRSEGLGNPSIRLLAHFSGAILSSGSNSYVYDSEGKLHERLLGGGHDSDFERSTRRNIRAFSVDGRRFAGTAARGNLRLWQPHGSSPLYRVFARPGFQTVTGSFSRDGAALAILSERPQPGARMKEQSLDLLDAATGGVRWRLTLPAGNADRVRFGARGDLLVVADFWGRLTVVNTATGSIVARLPGLPANTVMPDDLGPFFVDGDSKLVGVSEANAYIWTVGRIAEPQVVRLDMKELAPPYPRPCSSVVDQDDRYITVIGPAAMARFELATGKLVKSGQPVFGDFCNATLTVAGNAVAYVAHPGGNVMTATTVQIYRLSDFELLASLPIEMAPHINLTFGAINDEAWTATAVQRIEPIFLPPQFSVSAFGGRHVLGRVGAPSASGVWGVWPGPYHPDSAALAVMTTIERTHDGLRLTPLGKRPQSADERRRFEAARLALQDSSSEKAGAAISDLADLSERGDAQSSAELSDLHANGEKVPADRAKALFYASIAVRLFEAQGDHEAAAALRVRRASLALALPSSLAASQFDAASRWRPK